MQDERIEQLRPDDGRGIENPNQAVSATSVGYAVEGRAPEDVDYWRAFQNMPLSMVLLDGDGWILDLNESWRQSACADGDDANACIGSNYVAMCDDASDASAREVHGLLEELVAGQRDRIRVEYSCHTANQRRWFLMQAHRYANGNENRIVVLHIEVTPWRLAQEAENRRAEADCLTSMLNRGAFNARAEQFLALAERNRRALAVLFIDIDGYKSVNDAYGHDVGDRLLSAIAERLQNSTRESDLLARYGGDEFVLMAEGADHCGAERLACQLRELIAPAISIDEYRFTVTCSMGIAMYPGDGEEVSTLIKAADTAMYDAKRAGGGRHAFAGEVE